MKTIQRLVVASIFIAASNHSNALNGGDFGLFGEACNSLKSQEKRKQCQVALEKRKGESKTAPDSKKVAKPQETRVPINFKDIPLGQAGALAALIEVCKQDKSNQPSTYANIDRCEYKKSEISFGCHMETSGIQ